MNRLEVDFLGTTFKNPVLCASGTYGFGEEYQRYYDVSKLGGFVTKGLTLEPRSGNTGTRIWESPMGMMNSIGLENPGMDAFLEDIYPSIRNLDTVVIPNVSGSDEDSYLRAVEKLNGTDVAMIELNISCPNVKCGGMAFGVDAEAAGALTEKVKKASAHPVIVKLSPNVTDIAKIAKAVEEAGADAISLINTLQGMAIDWKTRKIVFDQVYAGFSGPAVKPVALRMVHQAAHAVKIPVIGIGGIASFSDALEFIMAGASLVQVGAANFPDPLTPVKIIDGLKAYCEEEDTTIQSLTGCVG